MTRRGLVLGGGGVLGAAWMVGALTALEEHLGEDVRDFEQLVGTSAGSVLCALLAAGVSVTELRTHQMEGSVPHGRLAHFHWDYEDSTGGDRPLAPRGGFGSTVLLRKPIRELRQLPPMAVLAALLPEGRGRLDSVGALVRHVVGDGWVDRDGLTVVALDYDSGERVCFGRPGAPEADAAQAVMASCAIPGWYTPVTIHDRRYIDGGTWSSTNLDLLTGYGLDEVHVLAPQVSFDLDSPRDVVTRLERQWRGRVTAKALKELAVLHAEGTEVTMIGPGREDLEAIGGNLMDVGRRPRVMETSLRTSLTALQDPGPVPSPGEPVATVDDAELRAALAAEDEAAARGTRVTVQTRVYLPLDAGDLRALAQTGELGPAPRTGYAVTADLRRERPGADLDELEYVAFADAGSSVDPAAAVVAAADVDAESVVELLDPALAVSAVRVAGPVTRRSVASFHVAEVGGSNVAADGIPEYSWYDATELGVVRDLLG